MRIRVVAAGALALEHAEGDHPEPPDGAVSEPKDTQPPLEPGPVRSTEQVGQDKHSRRGQDGFHRDPLKVRSAAFVGGEGQDDRPRDGAVERERRDQVARPLRIPQPIEIRGFDVARVDEQGRRLVDVGIVQGGHRTAPVFVSMGEVELPGRKDGYGSYGRDSDDREPPALHGLH